MLKVVHTLKGLHEQMDDIVRLDNLSAVSRISTTGFKLELETNQDNKQKFDANMINY